MRICHLAGPWLRVPPLNYGGTELVIHDLIAQQVKAGNEVTLIGTADSITTAKLISIFEVCLIDNNIPWQAQLPPFYYMWKAFEYITDHADDFDVIHAHLSCMTDLCLYPVFGKLKSYTKTGTCPKVVITLHSAFPFDSLIASRKGEADDYILRDYGKLVPLVCISQSASDVINPRYKDHLNVVGIVHHGIPFDSEKTVLEMPRLDKIAHLNPSQPYLCWLGRFIEEKGPDVAIQVATELQMPLVLAGTVDRFCEPSVHYFDNVIAPMVEKSKGLVTYIGPVGYEDKNKLFHHAQAFLNPISWEEPFGMVMIEALKNGCPVVSFARGAAPEIIQNGKTGFLVDNKDQMIQATKQIHQIDRKACVDHIKNHFSVETMCQNYMKVYEKL